MTETHRSSYESHCDLWGRRSRKADLYGRPDPESETGLLGGKWTLDDFDPLEDMPADAYLTAFHSGNANEAKLQEMLDFVKTYSVDVKPEKVFQLSEMRKAHEYLGSSRSFGKVVVMSE